MLWYMFLHDGPLPWFNRLCIDVHIGYVGVSHDLPTFVDGVNHSHARLRVARKLLKTFILVGLGLAMHLHIEVTG